MSKPAKIKLANGMAIAPGTYRINSQSLHLAIAADGVFLVFTTAGGIGQGLSGRIEIPGMLATPEEDIRAKEIVVAYLWAAYMPDERTELTQWLAHMESMHGPECWRRRYFTPDGLIRWKVNKEVVQWQDRQ